MVWSAASLLNGLAYLARLFQSSRRFVQRFGLFAEGKAHLTGAVSRIAIETRSRHASHSNFLHKIFRERNIVVEAKRGDVGHHIISAPRTEAPESGRGQRRDEMIAPHPVSLRQPRVIFRRQT